VLIEGNSIRSIGENVTAPGAGAYVIDGSNKTLMPGLIDAHWHAMMAALPPAKMMTAEVADLNFMAAQEAKNTLIRGFTSVRDSGGPVFALLMKIWSMAQEYGLPVQSSPRPAATATSA